MITFRKYLELDEHPNLRQRIMTKINPLEKIKDKMADLKKKGGLTGVAKEKLKKELDKVNHMSPINKMKTMNTKEQIKKLAATKKDLSTKAKVIGGQIKGLRQTLKPK